MYNKNEIKGEIRSVTRDKYSYRVYLPIDMIRLLGIDESMEVVCKLVDNKIIITRSDAVNLDWKKGDIYV